MKEKVSPSVDLSLNSLKKELTNNSSDINIRHFLDIIEFDQLFASCPVSFDGTRELKHASKTQILEKQEKEEQEKNSTRLRYAFDIKTFLRPILFVSPSMKIIDLLLYMRETKNEEVLIIDEFGGVDGCITFELLIENIIGDIRDAHEVSLLQKSGDSSIIVDGRTRLDKLHELFGSFFDEENDEIETIAGLLILLFGYVPLPGESITLNKGIKAEILESDSRRIKLISLKNLPDKQKNKKDQDETL
jgi:CBS domain containing-hemolysin-like protein